MLRARLNDALKEAMRAKDQRRVSTVRMILAALQDRALAANLDLAIAAQRWKQAQLLVEQSALRWSPSAGLSANASRPVQTQSSTRNVDIGGVTVPVTTATGWSRSYGASVGVSYELDLWDRLAQGTAAQRAQAEAARVFDSGEFAEDVREAESFWLGQGISSVPSVVINERYLISGGQPPEVFEQAIRRVGARGA